jgi:hypothetical protein
VDRGDNIGTDAVSQVPVLPDDYGIGQEAVARIQREIAIGQLVTASDRLLSTSYVPDIEWPMWRLIFDAARNRYDVAMQILEAQK